MAANLNDLRAQLADTEQELYQAEKALLETALNTTLGLEPRAIAVAAYKGFKREVEALRNVERDLLEHGKTTPTTDTPTPSES